MHLYKQGLGILDILWALRLRNVETLQHYLQEISTEITMIDLPFPCRLSDPEFCKTFSSLYLIMIAVRRVKCCVRVN